MKCFVIGLPCLNYAHCITAVFCEAHPLSSMDTCIISEADGRSKLFQKSIRGPTKLISLWACSSNCVWAQRTENIASAQLQRHFTRRTIGEEQIKVRGELTRAESRIHTTPAGGSGSQGQAGSCSYSLWNASEFPTPPSEKDKHLLDLNQSFISI